MSVPATFLVLFPGQNPCELPPSSGAIFVAPRPTTGPCPPTNPAFPISTFPTSVRLVSMHHFPVPQPGKKPTVRNGVLGYRGPNGSLSPRGGPFIYYAPSLDIEVIAGGPMAIRVIDTLTRSPRSVALAKGPAPPVPSYWRSVTFAGMRFSVPASWPVERTPVTSLIGQNCATPPGATFSQSAVTLSTDTRPIEFPSCPYIPPIPKHPSDGVQVDSGLRVEPIVPLSFSAHCLDLHGLTACPASSPGYSILVLRVTVPGRIKPVFVSIGLAGNGMIARTILYSLRAA